MCRFWEDYFKWRKESRLQMIIMWKIIFWYISYLVNKVKADVFTSKYSTVSKFYTKKRLNSQFFVPKLTPPPRAVADWPFSSQLTSLMGCFNAHKIQVTTSLYWTLSLTYVRWARKTIKNEKEERYCSWTKAKKISMNVFSPILSFFQAFFSSLHTNQNTETRLFSGEGATSRKNHMSNTVISLRGVTQPLSKWRVFFLNKVPSTVTKCLQMWEKLSFKKKDVLRCRKQDFITKANKRAVVLPPRGLGHIAISARRHLIKAPTQQKHIEDMLKIMVFTLFSLKSRSNLVTQGSSWKCLWASIYCLNEQF